MNRTALVCTSMAALTLLGSAALLNAGPLNPPAGAVAPTYKTLTEVEPRTPIGASTTPGDSNSSYKITQAGSYYLTSNLTGAGAKIGIEIAASNVTIDLNGFALTGVALSTYGIATDAPRNNITIRNGAVSSWGEAGINLTVGGTGKGSLIEGVHASSNGSAGIYAGTNAVVRACTAFANDAVGIICSSNSLITGCTARENGTYGIEAISGSTVMNCSAASNGTLGIACDYGCTIANCSAEDNGDDGIVGFLGCTITGCTSYSNTGDGIRVTGDCTVQGNTCKDNGVGSSIAAGIHAIIGGNRIEGNNCLDNDFGIDIDNAGNMIVRNSCAGNTTNWVIASDNIYGPIINRTSPGSAPAAGNAAPGTMGSTDPNANFSY